MATPCITILSGCLTLIIGSVVVVGGHGETPVQQRSNCSYTGEELVSSVSQGLTLLSPDVMRCKGNDSCFAFFTYTPNETIEYQFKGCWEAPNDCDSPVCIGEPRKNNQYFCCCRGSMCNLNVEVPDPMEGTTPLPDINDGEGSEERMDNSYQWLWTLLIVAFVLVGTCVVVATRYWRKAIPPSVVVPPEEHPASPCIDLDSVNILETIGHGRFGTAYRAIVDDEEVAVKMFPQHHKSSYVNEKYIYSLPLMEHSNLLSYLGSGERKGLDGSIYYGLVLSYCPKGRLSHYLAENTLPWSTFCNIALSATRGLAHLHSEIRKGDIVKPCICHRDFNTRNLLLTENLKCVVSDLGFGIHCQGSKYYINGEEQHAETSSLTDVGTHRYMAPEVLEGAVNLRDCEAALKQIDIYALGLVLWECAARCHDLYQGLQTPPYMLPFQAEIGLHPTFEQVQVLVVRNKARPLFPSVWKDTNPAIRSLKETIDECWDYDAEARLSAMCVEGRLRELPKSWDRYKSSLGISGVSPTMNPLSNLSLNQRPGEMFNGGRIISNAITPRDKESSVSEATVETTISGSPSEPSVDVILGKKAKNQLIGTLQPPIPSIQPHQGHNPCLERNLIREIQQEISVSGNILIDPQKSSDINSINTINVANLMDVQQAIEAHGFTNEQLMPLLNGHSNTANVVSQPRPTLPPPTLVPPIPYLQNEVHPIDRLAKRQNTSLQESNDNRKVSKGSSWRRWRSAWEDRLKSLIPRRRHHNSEDEERQEILITPTSSSFSEPPTPQSLTVTSHLPLQTEVLLTNGGPHTVISPNHTLNSHHSAHPNYATETEIGIAKLHFQNGFAPIIRSRQGSKDSGLNKSSENSVSFVDSDNSCEKLKRPTTLVLLDRSHKCTVNNDVAGQEINTSVNHDDQNKESNVTDPTQEVEESPPLRKAKHRVKTPRRPMNPRLSLYDDRIMGCDGERNVQSAKSGHLDLGLSHSLPLHMNALERQQPFLTTNVVVSSASSLKNSAASLKCSNLGSKVSSSSTSSNNSSSSSSSTSTSNSSRRASSRDGSHGLLGQELTFSCTQPNPQSIGVL